MEETKKKFGSKKQIAIVNAITASRFLGSFLVIPTFKVLGGISASVFSAIFLLTDFIDGHLARKWNSSTFFGALFDGTTDKAYGIMACLLLMTINPVAFSIPLIMELAIVLAQKKKLNNDKNVQSNMIGKIKTWFLSMSIVGSFVAVDLLNMPEFIEYLKYASLDKVACIRDFLVLLGIQLPTTVAQILTLRSYNKEAENEEKTEQIKPEILDNTIEEEICAGIDDEDPNIVLQNIAIERQQLEDEKTLLEKAKILGDALFDPEYYEQNKDMPIRTLSKDLFKNGKNTQRQ